MRYSTFPMHGFAWWITLVLKKSDHNLRLRAVAILSRIPFTLIGASLMESQTTGSRRKFLSTVAMTASGAIMLRPRLGGGNFLRVFGEAVTK